MFLKKLVIQNGNEVIRDIPFHKGINLIVDESSSDRKTDSGNSVGKTTVLRLIDFCLDGQGKNIYVDPGFKSTNTTIEKFLTENNIIITLILVDDLFDDRSKEVVIKRNFLKYKQKVQSINDEDLSNDEFSRMLMERVFKTTSDKPTFKQLKSKNIRDEKNKLINTIRVLTPNVTTDVAYEALHLFWLGIDVDLSKDKLVRKQNIEEKLQTRLRKESNISQINQSLIIVNKEIKSLSKKKEIFNLNDEYEEDLKSLNTVKFEINSTSSRLSRLEMRKELIEESKADLESGIANLDTQNIQMLYKKAKALIPGINKTFQDTLKFHNDMIEQKVRFIAEDLPTLNHEISQKRRKSNSLLTKEKKLSDTLRKTDAINGLE